MDLVRTCRQIFHKAHLLGFDAVGVSKATLPEKIRHDFNQFLERGFAGDMSWMRTRIAERTQPRKLWPQTCRILSLGMSYAPKLNPRHQAQHHGHADISIYAQNRDYHKLVKGKLKHLAQFMVKITKNAYPDTQLKVFVDTAPVAEKPIAQQAGIGWQGKHTNIVSRSFGNWLFLGEIYTTLPLPVSHPEGEHCGSCSRCLDICPTKAFPAPHQLDARRCISYLTIEHPGPFPTELRTAMGNHIYGCDDCLSVCPWNKFATASPHEAFWPKESRVHPSLAKLATFDDHMFRQFFTTSPIKRIGIVRFKRNVLNAIGNTKMPHLIPYIQPHLQDDNPIVRDSAQWALQQLSKTR